MSDLRVVVDASAVLAFVLNERAAQTVAKLLPYAVIPAPNMTEVLYRAPERGYRDSLDGLYTNLLDTGLTVEPFAAEDAIRAAELVTASRAARTPKDDRSLSLGDGLCLAVAERLNLPVTDGDGHWNSIDLNVKFYPLTMR